MGMDAPYWLDVPAPDLDYHISSYKISAGGGWREFEQLLTDLHRQGLNMSKPLWEIGLVRGLLELPGLPANCQALVLKIHHAAIDGVSLAQIIDAMHREAVPGDRSPARAQASLMVLAPVPFHTMVSHVPGPTAPLRLGKAELVVPLGFGPVRDNMGLFHIVSNSSSKVSLSFNACDRLLPDGEFYQQCLQRSFTALFEDAMSQRTSTGHP
jgi:hypothetical protein